MARFVRFTIGRAMVMVGGAAVVLAVMAPAIQASREQARKDRCVANLRQLLLGVHNYHEVHEAFPPGVAAGPEIPPEESVSWAAPIWSSWSKETRLAVDPARPWDASPNWPPKVQATDDGWRSVREIACEGLTCPDEPSYGRVGPAHLSYVGVAGLGPDAATLPTHDPRSGIFGYERVANFASVMDGLSVTIMFVETAHEVGPFTAGGPSSVRGFDTAARRYVGPGRPFGGLHHRGAYVGLADGSVKFAKESISDSVYESLATMQGGETIPGDPCN